ncbi:hypothetical protein ACYCMP_25545 [Klebsiella pneumoniae]|uniref:hypothetical protein n=1 Tax=Klebsiella pneumoniae complex TaxID=3390273 RepID=UPI000F7EC070|nr:MULTISPECIES: hypothetical protein [Klebsiella]RTD69144.1 hypothetical protein EJ896_21230 [Klebsiella quasipneumoniae subsp. similipneumoniae]
MIEKVTALTATPEENTEQTLPEPALPDLTRQRKLRSRTDAIISTAKKMLVSGIGPNEVACRLRLDPAVVLDLYQSWNPRYRKVTPHNGWTCQKLAIQCFGAGAPLAEICRITDRPLFSVIKMLTAEGVSLSVLSQYLPAETDPLMVEYRKTLARHEASPKRRPIQINPLRRSQTASATA